MAHRSALGARCDGVGARPSRAVRGRRWATMRRRAYGTSDADGTWREHASNAFTKLIDVARGQRDVVQAGAPALRDRAKEIDPREIDSAEIQELIGEMVRVMRARGVGLAAPQLGIRKRVIVLEDTEEGMSDSSAEELASQKRAPFACTVIINPTLERVGDASAIFFEGCLSVAGYRACVRRHLSVRCRGLGGDGKPVDFIATGWQARILQHELDHLDGVLYTDRMESRTFRRVDMLSEPLPGDHAEFGAGVVLGESVIRIERTMSDAESVEQRVKNSRKNRKGR
ncbi:Peptide deformylase [Ostreococcus tauri]|uniref:Peptide deformylase n=1 Tax=Ostreococcus tauri TaxID=70448 RepID=A0A096PAE0_OSTTA|nr:Peptide deformylase [Ostreococcus tauri]CEG01277.1 Peptide deformylase [Ostreococcus tauri]|eukprot:XP_022840872.1 Peptide deformylase [Ostreococcus tauri]